MLVGMAKIDIPLTGKLCRMHDGLYAPIPRRLRDAYNLAWRDEFEWVTEEDGLKLKFSGSASHDPREVSP
jgi:hypothetical protein